MAGPKRQSTESLSPHTVNAYASALSRLKKWLGKRPLDDERLAEYLDSMRKRGVGKATAGIVICTVRRAAHDREAKPANGRQTAEALKQFRPEDGGSPRRRKKSSGMTAEECAVLPTDRTRRRRRGPGLENAEKAERRGQMDRAIVALLCHAGLRRSKVSVLRWKNVEVISAGDVRVRVEQGRDRTPERQKKTRRLRGDAAKAIWVLHRAVVPSADDTAVGLRTHQVNYRFKKACAAAGLEGRTSQDGRVGLARELAAQGASVEAIQTAGGWKGPGIARHDTEPARGAGRAKTRSAKRK